MEKGAQQQGNIFDQMAMFDFNKPINVTIICEDINDESLYRNVLKEQIQNDDNICNPDCLYARQNTEKINSDSNMNIINTSAKKFTKEGHMETQLPNDFEELSTTEENSQTTADSTLEITSTDDHIAHNNLESNNTRDIEESLKEMQLQNLSELYKKINDNEELTAYVKRMLDVVSHHIILIMRPFYYYTNSGKQKTPNYLLVLENLLNRHKHHFFNLSFSTIVSLIIPQENNVDFIRKFIDATVADAKQQFGCKCERQHVESVFNEMVAWAKQKQQHINTLQQQQSFSSIRNNSNGVNDNGINDTRFDEINLNGNMVKIFRLNNNVIADNSISDDGASDNGTNENRMNDNRMLKEQLAGPPRLISNPQGTCIFQSGTPGREIRINVNPEVLRSYEKQQHNHGNQNSLKTNETYCVSTQTGQHVPSSPYQENRVIQPNYHPQTDTVHHKHAHMRQPSPMERPPSMRPPPRMQLRPPMQPPPPMRPPPLMQPPPPMRPPTPMQPLPPIRSPPPMQSPPPMRPPPPMQPPPPMRPPTPMQPLPPMRPPTPMQPLPFMRPPTPMQPLPPMRPPPPMRTPQPMRPPPPYIARMRCCIPTTIPNNMHPIPQNVAQTMCNYRMQRNMNNIANNAILGPMYGQLAEVPASTTPDICVQTNGCCCVCGRITNMKCSTCNKYYYCSYLCQELDSGVHKAECPRNYYYN